MTKGTPPRVPFARYKNVVLGETYELSLVFIGIQRMRSLNKKYRNKDTATDILSFPYSGKEGEIFLNLAECKRSARLHNKDLVDFLAYIFIHGCLHLKGFSHGSTMEDAERRFIKRLHINY